MTKIRKHKRRKTYQFNVNRKRLRNKQSSLGNIQCLEIKREWNRNKTLRANLDEMGLSFDPNTTIKIPSNKEKYRKTHVLNTETGDAEEKTGTLEPAKKHVVEALERDARAPRVNNFRLPKKEVARLSQLLDKYGSDYKAMARDKGNHYQDTWKQIRAKIKRFRGIPEQYSVYLSGRNGVDPIESEDCLSDGEL